MNKFKNNYLHLIEQSKKLKTISPSCPSASQKRDQYLSNAKLLD